MIRFDATSQRIDGALAGIRSRLPSEDSSAVAAAIHYSVAGGGKRLRAALCFAAHDAVGGTGDPEAVAGLAAAIEIIHTYSLMHDDLPCMDDDDVRRGRPTTHRVYGSSVTMLAGAALIPLAFRVLLASARQLALDEARRKAIALELACAAGGGGMVAGQALDLASEGQAISLEDLESIHRTKTGALISAAARIGALAGGAREDQLRALRTYARRLGLAFQITDDVLDETTPSAHLGKTAGKDRVVRKATFPAMMGVDAARRRAAEETAEALSALDFAAIRTPELEAIARFAIERDR